MPKIVEMYAFVATDKDENDEGIMAYFDGKSWMPMVGSDMERVESLRPFADKLSQIAGKPYKILKFVLEKQL